MAGRGRGRNEDTGMEAEEIPFTIANRTPIVTVCPQTGKEIEVRGLTWEELNETGLLSNAVDTAEAPTLNVFSREVRYRMTHVPQPLTDAQKAAQRVRNGERRERVKRALALLAEAEANGDLDGVDELSSDPDGLTDDDGSDDA